MSVEATRPSGFMSILDTQDYVRAQNTAKNLLDNHKYFEFETLTKTGEKVYALFFKLQNQLVSRCFTTPEGRTKYVSLILKKFDKVRSLQILDPYVVTRQEMDE